MTRRFSVVDASPPRTSSTVASGNVCEVVAVAALAALAEEISVDPGVPIGVAELRPLPAATTWLTFSLACFDPK
jgi:hypothetical protein